MKNIFCDLNELIVYRRLLDDDTVKKICNLIRMSNDEPQKQNMELKSYYYEIYYNLVRKAEEQQMSGNLWKNYILMLILEDENVFSLACEKAGEGISQTLYDLVINDMDILKNFYELDWTSIEKSIGIDKVSIENDFQVSLAINCFRDQYNQKIKVLQKLFSENASLEVFTRYLIEHYHTIGCGSMAKYTAFRWENELVGIEQPDSVKLEDLIGYKHQKEVLIDNTEAFIKGYKANNVLLYGDKGTGKSSSVKALINQYADKGLRMIELSKYQLSDFTKIVEIVKKRGQRFIVFLDDLSFEDFETDYKYIKSTIEGGLEAKPNNLLIYATSNRRHLIKENWSDRKNFDNEIHISDSVQEKLSIADRFGITITYLSPNQEQYLNIVNKLARKNGIDVSADDLKKKAIQWEMSYHGRSGRTAKQFIDHLSAKMENSLVIK